MYLNGSFHFHSYHFEVDSLMSVDLDEESVFGENGNTDVPLPSFNTIKSPFPVISDKNQNDLSTAQPLISQSVQMHQNNITQPKTDELIDGIGNGKNKRQRVHAIIIVQPAQKPKGYKFRYRCEGKRAGSIHGANSTNEHTTYVTLQVAGCQERALVVVSCVTKDPPYR